VGCFPGGDWIEAGEEVIGVAGRDRFLAIDVGAGEGFGTKDVGVEASIGR